MLGEVLDALLRLLHPMIPFVTETLWTALTGGESVVIAPWPVADPSRADAAAEATVAQLQAVVTEGRRLRSDQGVKPAQRVPARVHGVSTGEAEIRWLLRLDEAGDDFAPTATLATSSGASIEFDLSGAIDVAAERARLTKALAAAEKERAGNSAKLASDAFTAKAPEPVIAKVRDRLATAEADIERIQAALAALPPELSIRRDPIARPLPAADCQTSHNRSVDSPSVAVTEAQKYEALLHKVEAEIGARWGEGRMDPTKDRIQALVHLLGDPQRAYRSIHLTGTNGKTSTARMIDELLVAFGLRTGRFTSPHLETITERIVLSSEPVDARTFVQAYDELVPYLDLVDGQFDTRLSFFEVITALAYAIFADAPVDVAVVEVGLGGEWDATNVIDAEIAVVTPIDLDHTALLGDNVVDIAGRRPESSRRMRPRSWPRSRLTPPPSCCGARPMSARPWPVRASSSGCSTGRWR